MHRDDTPMLYRCAVDLEHPDLHKHPMLAFARVWRHVLVPGEVLFLPYGTYHFCRNVKPCLSYSRFHLDEQNLPGFLASYLDGDAPDIDHGEILWNASYELIKSLDHATSFIRGAASVSDKGNSTNEGEHTAKRHRPDSQSAGAGSGAENAIACSSKSCSDR